MKVITAVVNNPQFIEIQYYTLKKYFKGDYEFIVFNDAKVFPDFTNGYDTAIKEQINEMCTRLQIQCIEIPNAHHSKYSDPSVRCADSMNFMLTYQKTHPDQYLILDSDMFLVDDLDSSYYSSYECAILLQLKYEKVYFWHGICYMDTTKMNNMDLLNWNCCDGCDTGGMMNKWLLSQCSYDDLTHSNHPQFYFIRHYASGAWDTSYVNDTMKQKSNLITFLQSDPRNENGAFFCELYDNKFLHYRAGCNWRGEGLEMHRRLSQMLKDALLV